MLKQLIPGAPTGRSFVFAAMIALLAPISQAGRITDMITIWGPEQYTRVAGLPETFVATFEHCGTSACQLVVVNGHADGTNRVSSANVYLNGTQILGPSDFNQQVAETVTPVVIADDNELTITLASEPGSFLTVHVECVAPLAALSTLGGGVSLYDPTTLLVAIPIQSNGMAAADNVSVTAIALAGGTLTSPVLPVNLGSISPGGRAVLDMVFSGTFAPRGSYPVTVSGTYTVGEAAHCFTLETVLMIPPAAPGSGSLSTVTIPSQQVSGAPFPPQPLVPHPSFNKPKWIVPIAPLVPGTPTATPTVVVQAPSSAAIGAAPVVFDVNNGMGLPSFEGYGGVSETAEPSGGSSGAGVIFSTANYLAAFSTDDGGTFTALNPSTIFPPGAVPHWGGDQIALYVPSIDRFIWLSQGLGYRLASASPAEVVNSGGTAWTYWTLSPDLVGSCTWGPARAVRA